MKITTRTGFVSNSSSTSFICELNKKEYTVNDDDYGLHAGCCNNGHHFNWCNYREWLTQLTLFTPAKPLLNKVIKQINILPTVSKLLFLSPYNKYDSPYVEDLTTYTGDERYEEPENLMYNFDNSLVAIFNTIKDSIKFTPEQLVKLNSHWVIHYLCPICLEKELNKINFIYRMKNEENN